MAYVTTVDVPPATPPLEFALEGVRPNPARRGSLVVHFTLAEAGASQIELFDVRGRRVAGREVRGESGRHDAIDLAEMQSIPVGVYLVRLTQGTQTRVGRVVVVD